MKQYKIEVKETLSRIVIVDSDSQEDALDQVRALYRDEEVVLDSDDHVDTEYIVIPFFKETQDFKKFLIEIDRMPEMAIREIMGDTNYIDTPGMYQDEKEHYDGILDFMKSNMGSDGLQELKEWWEQNVKE